MKVDTFTNYRYYKPKTHNSPKIALKIVVDHTNPQKTIKFSYAVCTSADNFSRKFARDLTDQRMENGDVLVGNYDTNISLIENAKEITQYVAGNLDESHLDADARKKAHNIQLLNSSFIEVFVNQQIEGMIQFGGDMGVNVSQA